MGNAIVKLVKKVKKLEGFLKRRNLVLTDSEDEEPEAQGRKGQADPQDSSIQGLVTPPTTKAHASGEEQEEDISPNTLEAAKTLSKVASLKSRSIDKGRRYKRRKETKGKKVVSSLDFQEDNTGAEKINTAGEINAASIEVNTASKVNTGSIELNTVIEQDSTAGENKGQREGKLLCSVKKLQRRPKEQNLPPTSSFLQEEASLAEAIRLDSLQKEEEAEQIHLDALLAQRIAEEEELTEQQKKRKAQVQFEAQHYTNEDWDLIRAKLEANAELSKSMLGSELQGEDFAKKMVDLVNQRKKFFAEERSKLKGTSPWTQSQLKTLPDELLKESKLLIRSIKQGEKGVYQIVRADGTDIVYINFGAVLKSISRDDLTELYRIVMNRYGLDRPEDKLEKGFWKVLRIWFVRTSKGLTCPGATALVKTSQIQFYG
ncbi:hypothetical protein Tco_0038427 [Tanacetum coccineum]